MEFPDSDAAVALALLEKIIELETAERRNETPAARLLDLYAQCLAAVRGQREGRGGLH